MEISFVILTWNSAAHIETCIRSLIKAVIAEKITCEIFIVDNGSRDDTLKIIKYLSNEIPGIINLIPLGENTGTTYSRNLALRKVSGRFVAILDSDIELKNPIFHRMITTLVGDGKTGLVVPKLLYPSGMLQKSTDSFPTLSSKFFRYFFLKVQEKYEGRREQLGGDVDYAISAFWLLKREVLAKVGLLDENIFYAPEDVDYCLRIWKAGFRIRYLVDVSAVHHAQEISRGLKINSATIQHIKGLIYFFKKHNYLLRKPVFVQSAKRYESRR